MAPVFVSAANNSLSIARRNAQPCPPRRARAVARTQYTHARSHARNPRTAHCTDNRSHVGGEPAGLRGGHVRAVHRHLASERLLARMIASTHARTRGCSLARTHGPLHRQSLACWRRTCGLAGRARSSRPSAPSLRAGCCRAFSVGFGRAFQLSVRAPESTSVASCAARSHHRRSHVLRPATGC